MRRIRTLCSLFLVVTLLAGCGQQPPAPTEEDVTPYDCGELQAAVPTEYADQMVVDLSPDGDPFGYPVRPLLIVYEKVSLEVYEAAWGEEAPASIGYLFGISVLDQAAYEQHLCAPGGSRIFARDDDGNYYAHTFSTTVEMYRSEDGFDREGWDWKNFQTLTALGDTVCLDAVTRNGLTPYTDLDFWAREFTYGGEHVYLNYYPSLLYIDLYPDSALTYSTLVLSQPVRQGEGGIWCVERYYKAPHWPPQICFPDSGKAAADHYAQLQADCDAGKRDDLLTPLGAAMNFALEHPWFSPNQNLFLDSMGPAPEVETTARAFRLTAALLNDSPADPMELLDCAGHFTPDTWAALSQWYAHGEDWWAPWWVALEGVSLGDGQEDRDRAMCRLYLSAHWPFAEDIAGLLHAQQAADPTAFDAVLMEFSAEYQAVLRDALDNASS